MSQSNLRGIIRGRRSVKSGYLDAPVSQDLILELLNDAVWAPTHGLREPWRFLFVPSEAKEQFVNGLIELLPEKVRHNVQTVFMQPAVILTVIMNKDSRQKEWEEDFGAVSSMLQNFQLLAWEQQLGVVWKTPPFIHDSKVREYLDVQADEQVVGFLHMGYFANEPKASKRTAVEDKFTVFDESK
ncbi:nitroreductase [Bacillus sp. HMF5848]|uniref:nitroreductase family protein n=1 Tax=Bacillus sp. HMF5848 TaxID=2495421 RepID=UPI000F77B4D3|nr:nitroreductase [Bacillus sp. HMF5848]RSK25609.1 nitroreductase [Bacillus sp. HMF5848]